MVNFGLYLVMGYVGVVFVVVVGLLYLVVGVMVVKFWYNECISVWVVVGIVIIILGGVVIYGLVLVVELYSGSY